MRTLLHLLPEGARERDDLLRRERGWLRERDLALVLADERIESSDRAHYADAIALPPPHEVAATLDVLRPFARKHRLAGVIAQSEWALTSGSLLAKELSLPGSSPEAVLRSLGKHLTRAALARARVTQPEFALVQDAAGVRRFAQAHGLPVIVKALASTMARLVTRVDDAGAIDAAVASLKAGLARADDVTRLAAFARAARLDVEADPRATFLVESCVDGAPLECDGFVASGAARSFGVVEQRMTPAPRFYLEAYLLPPDRPQEELRAVQALAEHAALAVGLDAAGFCVELRASAQASGPAGPAKVIEVNGRLGEDAGLHRLFELATGASPFRLAVATALGEAARFASALHSGPRHALAYQSTFEPGIVARLPGAAELAALRAAGVEAGLCVAAGDRMHAPPHPETFPHLAWTLASDASSSRAAHARAREQVERLRFELVPSGAT